MAYVGSQFGTFFGGTALEELSVGQCFNGGRGEYGPAAAIISTVEVVACTEPHTSELIATLDYPGAGPAVEFPGIDSVQTFALQECIDSFADYVGIDYDESELEITYVYPLEHNWNAGDYSIQCIVHPPVGQDQTTQSYRRARR